MLVIVSEGAGAEPRKPNRVQRRPFPSPLAEQWSARNTKSNPKPKSVLSIRLHNPRLGMFPLLTPFFIEW